MSSCSSDQGHHHQDQTPPALPGSDSSQNGESGRHNPFQEVQLTPQIQVSNTDQTEPFKTPYNAQQAQVPNIIDSSQAQPGEDSLKFGVQEVNKAGISSVLDVVIPKEGQLVKHHWVTGSPELDGTDPLTMLNKMGKAISELSRDRVKLQECLREKLEDNEDHLRRLTSGEEELKEDLKICQQEREEYKQKYDTVVETEAKMRVYYESMLELLESRLKELRGKKEEADKQHKQDKALLTHTVEIQGKYCIELEQKLKKQSSELSEFDSHFKAKQAEVEQLRESLQQREKELEEMKKEHMTRTAEVRELERKAKELTISQEKETTKEQLQGCQQIRDLVQRLPQVTTQEDLEAITKQINDDITKMKVTTTHRRAVSWR